MHLRHLRNFLLLLTIALPLWQTPASADTEPPRIMAAGYGRSFLVAGSGGTLEVVAFVDTRRAFDVATVELYHFGSPTGLLLHSDPSRRDEVPNSEYFSLSLTVPGAGLPAGRFLFEIVATDTSGNKSRAWPYQQVVPAANPAPAPSIEHWEELREHYLTRQITEYAATLGQSGSRQDQRAAFPGARILYGGYWNFRLQQNSGGFLSLMAFVESPDDQISEVPLFFQGGSDLGILLRDDGSSGDLGPGDKWYGYAQFFFGPLPPTGLWHLETEARTTSGLVSDRWPYLTVYSPTPTATPDPNHSPTPTPTGTPQPTQPSPTPTPTPTPTATPDWNIACFRLSPGSAQLLGEYVEVNVSCSNSPGDPIQEYQVDWGDGAGDLGGAGSSVFRHAYLVDRPEPYMITLTIRTGAGKVDSESKPITIIR